MDPIFYPHPGLREFPQLVGARGARTLEFGDLKVHWKSSAFCTVFFQGVHAPRSLWANFDHLWCTVTGLTPRLQVNRSLHGTANGESTSCAMRLPIGGRVNGIWVQTQASYVRDLLVNTDMSTQTDKFQVRKSLKSLSLTNMFIWLYLFVTFFRCIFCLSIHRPLCANSQGILAVDGGLNLGRSRTD